MAERRRILCGIRSWLLWIKKNQEVGTPISVQLACRTITGGAQCAMNALVRVKVPYRRCRG